MTVRKRGREFSPYAVTQLWAILKALLVLEHEYHAYNHQPQAEVGHIRKRIWEDKRRLYCEAHAIGYTKTMVRKCMRRLFAERRDPPETDQAMADYYSQTASRLEGRQAAAVRYKKSPL